MKQKRRVIERPKIKDVEEVDGYVWCDFHGEVHSDSLNPYGYTEEPETKAKSWCKSEYHRKLYMEPLP